MSVSGILSSIGNNQVGSSAASYQFQKSPLQQLGQDLASGNLTAAQSDFATLQKALAQPAAVSSSTSNPVAQAFQQLSIDLKSGNLSGAKQDYTTIQQGLRNQSPSRHLVDHHQPRIREGFDQNPLLQDLNQLGQDLSTASLQSGNLAAAQQAYAFLQQPADNGMMSGAPSDGSMQLSFPSATAPVSLLA